MTTYILLRKNKEYGPFHLDDLRKMGIFHNDLVWVEGQSVCWLHPEEIKELKGIATEESQHQAGSTPGGLSGDVNFANDKFMANIDENNKDKEGSCLHKVPKANPGLQNAFSANYLTSGINSSDVQTPAPPEYKLSQEQHKKGLLSIFPVPVKIAASVAALILIGMVAGILIGRNSGKKSSLTEYDQKTSVVSRPVSEINSSNKEPIDEVSNPEKEKEETTSTTVSTLLTETELPGKNIPVPVKKNTSGKPTAEHKESSGEQAPKNTSVISSSDERPARNRSTEKDQAPAVPENIISQVSVVTNDYLVGSFGGIKNLELTVRNDSKYNLEKVTVELQYLKPLDELLRTQNIEFSTIPPFSSKTLPVSKTNRGVKVKCRVVKVVAAEQGTHSSGF